MSELTLLLSLLIAAIVPRLALRYLQPILMQVLHRLCEVTSPPLPGQEKEANSGPEFWWRVLNVLAISGSMLLVLTFGYSDGSMVTLNDFLRRTLWLVTLGVFLSVSMVAFPIWSRIAPTPAASPRFPSREGHAGPAPLPAAHAGLQHHAGSALRPSTAAAGVPAAAPGSSQGEAS
ncbi:hypothetical protein SAMN05216359_11390 [Roseateles sp. YR242]|uniref:hypothetical protein n=1 Tax=Roseateles sp. YR242 TaxID=1855305 RepID=UPI0008BA1225|nr:hypothetical protein [Roseateles sp. YR242]SEL67072.1 hypothetical protein SAMN05216359_11390 [Roseateles sp. YR242]